MNKQDQLKMLEALQKLLYAIIAEGAGPKVRKATDECLKVIDDIEVL